MQSMSSWGAVLKWKVYIVCIYSIYIITTEKALQKVDWFDVLPVKFAF